jgi:hypothetical protein|tara:strand:+ start:2290 stop:2781 length:492 start_codon:yes stop_codon:yes gene_type:complete
MANKLEVGVGYTPEGNTFLAITAGPYGGWGLGADLQSAIETAVRHTSDDKVIVQVWFGRIDDMGVNDFGCIRSMRKNPPTPVGLFVAQVEVEFGDEYEEIWNTTISFLKPKEVYEIWGESESTAELDQLNHTDWVKKQQEYFSHNPPMDLDLWLGKNFEKECK